jgi:hypothetical protein
MSLIHWDKSVFNFHLQEILEDHHRGDRTALIGLGAVLVGTVVLPAVVKLGKPLLKKMIKTGLNLSPSTETQTFSKPQFQDFKLITSTKELDLN